MTSYCAYCDREVRPRQQALQCDRCMRWQHRTCQSVRKTTRTNNDCEGWHRRINHHARDSKPQMYVLIPILFEEAEKLPLQRQMVAEGTLKRLQRKNVRERQKRYNALWDKFEEGLLTPITLLQEVSRTCSPPA